PRRMGEAGGQAMTRAFLELLNISKSFPGVKANDDVCLEIRRQEVHAILGENGAGKSTLMNILYGFYHPDSGAICIDGHEVTINNPAQAKRLGIGMVFQQFMLIPNFTVIENVALALADTGFIIPRNALAERIKTLSDRYGFGLDPWATVADLSVGAQQKVEITKLLLEGAKLLIFDEPTSVLAPHEVDGLFQVFDRLRSDGYTVLFITHKMREVLASADRVSVLRRGRMVGTIPCEGATVESLVSLILGTTDSPEAVPVRQAPGFRRMPVLEMHGVSAVNDRGGRALHEVSLGLSPGEILGVAGVSGNGQHELAEAIMGLRPVTAGTIRMTDKDVTKASVGQRLALGIACIPEDPLAMAVVPDLTGEQNLALGAGREQQAPGWMPINWAQVRQRLTAIVEHLHLVMPRMDAPAAKLSGGNLQRLIIARELGVKPKVMLAYYPTHGLDIGATRSVHQVLRKAAVDGMAILLVSEDLDELMALSDRLAVMFHGEIVGEYPAGAVDVTEVGMLMTGNGRRTIAAAPKLMEAPV
ncbi:MAG: ABC transporter ATP-binding protein, partial [Chloroflexi bacterium]|nr:ABC transporter ATP-binding protein [Chloroflexota bacterium]